MSVKLEVRESWLMDCMVRQLPIAYLMQIVSKCVDENNRRRTMAQDLAKRQQEILGKAGDELYEIEREWHRRQGG